MRAFTFCTFFVGAVAAAFAADIPATRPSPPPTAPVYGKPIQTDIQRGGMIEYTSNIAKVRAYLVKPKGTGPFPGVVVVHDIFGLNAWARQQADELARQGYIVIAPDLYSRQGEQFDGKLDALDAKQAWIAYERMTDNQAVDDLKAAVTYLFDRENKLVPEETPVGVVGFDMGGIYAILLAGSDLRVKSGVNFYGRAVYAETSARRPLSPADAAFNLHAPLLSFYGTIDPQNPPDQVRLLESRLVQNPNRVRYEIVRYPDVGHGFVNANRQGYNKTAAVDAHGRTRDFLAKVLRAAREKAEE